MITFIFGFTISFLLWGISVGLKIVLKSLELSIKVASNTGQAVMDNLMKDKDGNIPSNSLYGKLRNGGKFGSFLRKGLNGVKSAGRLGKNTVKLGVKTTKFAIKAGKAVVKLTIKAIKLAIRIIRFVISVIKALISLIATSTVALIIIIILLLLSLIAAVIVVIIGNEEAKKDNVNFETHTIGELSQSSGGSDSSEEEAGADSAYSTDVATRIVQVACSYAESRELKYVYGGNGASGGIDCSHFACGVVLEATGYTWKGRKSSKNFRLTKGVGNNADYCTTGSLFSTCPSSVCVKKGKNRYDFLSTKEIKKLAKPGDIFVNKSHAAIFYGEVDGKLYWIEAAETGATFCSKTIEDAKKGKGGHSLGISKVRDVSIIIRPACKISKLNK